MRKVLFILSELSNKDIDWLLSAGHRQEVAAGTVIIEEGQPTDALYIVLDGTLNVSVASLGSRKIATIGCGEVLGEMSFVDGRPPAATVKAIEDCLVLTIPREKLNEKLEQDVLFALRFYQSITKFLSHRLRGTFTSLGNETDKSLHSQTEARNEEDDQEDDLGLYAGHNIDLARARFDQLIQRLKSNSG